MKPTITLNEKTGVPVVQQQGPTEVSPKSKWLKYAGLCLLLIFMATVTVFIVMTYNNTKASGQKVDTDVTVNMNGAKKTKQSDVEVNVTYHIVPSGEEIKENIVVSDQEEVISTPKARMIYDYRSGYFITKFTDSDDDTCYVNEFNVTGSIAGIRDNLVKEKSDQFVYDNSTEVVYESTNERVNKTLLSPRASEMCANSKVVSVSRSSATGDESSQRIKRACQYRSVNVCRTESYKRCSDRCTGWWRRRRCNNTCQTYYKQTCENTSYTTCS